MGDVHLLLQNDLTRAIAERLTEVCDAAVRVDEESHSKYLTEDDRAVPPDGGVHIGRPSAAEMAAAPLEDYGIAHLQARPVGDNGAIVSYTPRSRCEPKAPPADSNSSGRSVAPTRRPMEVPLTATRQCVEVKQRDLDTARMRVSQRC